MKITVLGCSSSMGTPAAGGFWGVCDPNEPRNTRTRASILVQSDTTNVLVDCSYDLREQLNRINLQKIDGVLISHHHSDHVNGLDDLRPAAYHAKKPLDVYGDAETMDEIERRWPYLFHGSNDIYVPFLNRHDIGFYDTLSIGDVTMRCFEQDHATCKSVGIRIGNFAYSPDMADLDEKSLSMLAGLDTWLVDCSGYKKEPVNTHANLARVLAWVDRLKPKMTYLTILTGHMDYKTLCDELPPHIRPAYDGLEIDISGGNLR